MKTNIYALSLMISLCSLLVEVDQLCQGVTVNKSIGELAAPSEFLKNRSPVGSEISSTAL